MFQYTRAPMQEPPVWTEKLWAKLMLAVGGVALTLALLEGSSRVFDLQPASGEVELPPWVRDYERLGIEENAMLGLFFNLYEWDRFLFYRTRPNLDLEMVDVFAPARIRPRTKWHISTNSRGFRDHEHKAVKGSNEFLVVAVGDSSIFGWGVSIEERFAAVAERSLTPHPLDRVAEIANFGTPGYSSFQALALLRQVLTEYDADGVVFSVGANDMTPAGIPDRELYEWRTSWLGAVESILYSSRAYDAASAWATSLGLRGRTPGNRPDEAHGGSQNVTLDEYKANLREAAALARKHGAHFVFLGVCLDDETRGAIRAVAQDEGVGFLDAQETMFRRIPELASGELLRADTDRLKRKYGSGPFRDIESSRWVLLPDECHPNPVGHRLIGEALGNEISRWYKLP